MGIRNSKESFFASGLVITAFSLSSTILISGVLNIVFADDNSDKKTIKNSTKIVESGFVAKIHDGDTITVSVTREFNVRLIDCWAPEITGKEKDLGLKSKAGLESIIKIGDQVRIEIPTEKNQPKTTLGRTLARVYKDIDNDGSEEDISIEMVNRGLAKSKK